MARTVPKVWEGRVPVVGHNDMWDFVDDEWLDPIIIQCLTQDGDLETVFAFDASQWDSDVFENMVDRIDGFIKRLRGPVV